MSAIVHFIDVGQGNMVLVQCAYGNNFVVDCNVTEANQARVLGYVAAQIGFRSPLRAFICTHRDADHMRGVRTLHSLFPIQAIWDSDYLGTSTDSDEYDAYMRLRREVGSFVIEKGMVGNYGRARFRFLSAKDARLPNNANDQGIVLKVEQLTAGMPVVQGSTILPGDGSCATWKNGILNDYLPQAVSCDILMAAHHGSLDFFEDTVSSYYYYVQYIQRMAPAMTVVSVGPNNYGHPDPTALGLYLKYSSGSDRGDKVLRTDEQGTAKLTLKSEGGWHIAWRQ